MKTLVADSQFSSRKLREQLSAINVKTVIPYPANQSKEKKTLVWRIRNQGCSLQPESPEKLLVVGAPRS